MSQWPPNEAACYFTSPGFRAFLRSVERRLKRESSLRMWADEIILEATAQIMDKILWGNLRLGDFSSEKRFLRFVQRRCSWRAGDYARRLEREKKALITKAREDMRSASRSPDPLAVLCSNELVSLLTQAAFNRAGLTEDELEVVQRRLAGTEPGAIAQELRMPLHKVSRLTKSAREKIDVFLAR